jgi:hypothetical protein
MKKKLISILFCLTTFACSGSKTPPNIILLPIELSLDQAAGRLFVVDSENNGLSLINTITNSIVTKKPLLNKNSTIRLPDLPQGIAAVNLGNDVTRVFIIGNGPAPRNRILVLDYDSVAGLQIAPISPIIVGADDANDQPDLLGGLTLDETHGTLFVSNSSDGLVRAYDVTTGTEKAGSPLTVGPQPSKMGLDPTVNLLCVSSLGGTAVSVIHTDDLTIPVSSFDTGLQTGSVAAATNAAGTVLFAVSPVDNEIRVFLLNIADPATSTPIGSPITAPAVGQPDTPQNLLTGAAAQAAAAPLADGRIAGLITQSTGDLGFIDVAADLSSFATGRTTVLNGQGAEGIAIFKDSAGNGIRAYFAAPGGSTVSFVDITTNVFSGQIF